MFTFGKYVMIRTLTYLVVFILGVQFSYAQKYEMYKGDTINYEDASGLKRGYWMVTNKIKKLPDYGEDQLVEEGNYINNRKEGIWKSYYPNGKKKNEITYVNGRANGLSKFYYKSGLLSEEGNWVNGKWDGSYKFYYENGQMSYDWKYNNGKREGEQKYFHDNGNKMYEGNWKDGQENGELKEYNKDGQLVAVKVFKAGGKIDTVASKVFDKPQGAVVAPPKVENPGQISTASNTEVESVIEEDTERAWIGYKESGYHKVKTKSGQLIRDGTFDKGTFINGKAFKYAGGKLVKTIIYKNGKAIEVLDQR